MIQQTNYDVFSYYGKSDSSFMTNSLKFSNPRQQRGKKSDHLSSSLLSVTAPETSGEHNEAIISVHKARLTRATPAHFCNEASETQPAESDQLLKSVISAKAEPQSGEQGKMGAIRNEETAQCGILLACMSLSKFHFTPTLHLTGD